MIFHKANVVPDPKIICRKIGRFFHQDEHALLNQEKKADILIQMYQTSQANKIKELSEVTDYLQLSPKPKRRLAEYTNKNRANRMNGQIYTLNGTYKGRRRSF